MKLSDFKDKTLEVWPEHVDAYIAFAEVSTQWQVAGMGGPVGLNYASVIPTIDSLHRDKTQDERDSIFAAVRVIERAALEEMAKKP